MSNTGHPLEARECVPYGPSIVWSIAAFETRSSGARTSKRINSPRISSCLADGTIIRMLRVNSSGLIVPCPRKGPERWTSEQQKDAAPHPPVRSGSAGRVCRRSAGCVCACATAYILVLVPAGHQLANLNVPLKHRPIQPQLERAFHARPLLRPVVVVLAYEPPRTGHVRGSEG